MKPKWLIYLNDGRVGLGIRKYRRRNKTYYVVDGYGFYIDSVRPNEIARKLLI